MVVIASCTEIKRIAAAYCIALAQADRMTVKFIIYAIMT